MNYEQIEKIQYNKIRTSEEFKKLAKVCLSIAENSTLKDDEIGMWINAGVADMVRQGIDVANNIEDGLVQGALVMYIKSNFGMVDINEKELCNKRYISICSNLSLTTNYQIKEV